MEKVLSPKTFAEGCHLAHIRLSRGQTTRQVAMTLGLPTKEIWDIEHGFRKVKNWVIDEYLLLRPFRTDVDDWALERLWNIVQYSKIICECIPCGELLQCSRVEFNCRTSHYEFLFIHKDKLFSLPVSEKELLRVKNITFDIVPCGCVREVLSHSGTLPCVNPSQL